MLKIDLHIHTVASRHAFNTMLEYINKAKELKMDMIGFSEHGPANKSTLADNSYFECMPRLPQSVDGIRILKGVEANIIGGKDLIDINKKIEERLDYIMAGFHFGAPYIDQGKEKNTELLIKVIRSGKVDIITHPFNTKFFDIDIEKISEVACENDVFLELNISYIKKGVERNIPEFIEKAKKMIAIVKKNNKKLILGSDAHNIWELADDSIIQEKKNELGLTDDMIINNHSEELLKQLNVKE